MALSFWMNPEGPGFFRHLQLAQGSSLNLEHFGAIQLTMSNRNSLVSSCRLLIKLVLETTPRCNEA